MARFDKNGYSDVDERLNLFVYGTLMDDSRVEMLLNRKVESKKATLHNFLRMTPTWSFPFIVKRAGAATKGRVLFGISKRELAILDDFEDEGSMYYRRHVMVRLDEGGRKRCQTYVGDIKAISATVNPEVKFEDRFGKYVEKRIDALLAEMPTDRPDIDRRVLRELMGSALDNIISSHFDGNYICEYIMIRALEEARPPRLLDVLKNEELRPYAGNYMRLACQHIVFNQFVTMVRKEHPDAVRVSRHYFYHGIAILLGMTLYNRRVDTIDAAFETRHLDTIVDGRGYRDYARLAIEVADEVYDKTLLEELIAYVQENWHSAPTPLGAELEFSDLGRHAIGASSGEDPKYDSFNWFWDFDMYHRAWRLGGHIDSHRQMLIGQKRHRGFLEYAFGRFNILGDLSLPLFDSPWAMSRLINEAVQFLDVAPHSLHISMELTGGEHRHITDTPHLEEDLACLLLLGGDIGAESNGAVRARRVFNNELDTNFKGALHFSDRKHHFARATQELEEAADVMEYKFMRLHKGEHDYETLIHALKGYQFHTHARPVNVQRLGSPELPEQTFLRKWSAKPEPVSSDIIESFVSKVEQGLLEEAGVCRLDRRASEILAKLHSDLQTANQKLAAMLENSTKRRA